MEHISSKWILKCMNADQKRTWVEISRSICDCWRFWVFEHSCHSRYNFWSTLGFRQPKVFESKNRLEKVFLQVFGIIAVSPSVIIWWRGKQRSSCSCRTMRLHSSTVLYAINKISPLGFVLVDHHPYPPDLAPFDYYLFSKDRSYGICRKLENIFERLKSTTGALFKMGR